MRNSLSYVQDAAETIISTQSTGCYQHWRIQKLEKGDHGERASATE